MIPTDFDQLVGNESIKLYLMRLIERQAVAHSLLFAGPNGIGKSLFAQAFAAALMGPSDLHKWKIGQGIHPDLFHYRPEGKLGLHSIQSMRQFGEDVYAAPHEAKCKVLIIHEAERMLSYSANALLKTFEEPPAHSVIILLSNNPTALLPTVFSRCRAVYFQPIAEEHIKQFLSSRYELESQALTNIVRLAQGSLSKALQLAENKDQGIRTFILDILAQGKFNTYKEMTEMAHQVSEKIELMRKQAETAAKEDLYKAPAENLSAHQQNLLEKELEGIASLHQIQELYSLLEVALSWYRDLHLLRVGGQSMYLMNPDYEARLEQVLQRGHILPLDQVQKIIEETKLAIQRSTTLHVCVENLFLKLSLV